MIKIFFDIAKSYGDPVNMLLMYFTIILDYDILFIVTVIHLILYLLFDADEEYRYFNNLACGCYNNKEGSYADL